MDEFWVQNGQDESLKTQCVNLSLMSQVQGRFPSTQDFSDYGLILIALMLILR